NIIRPHIVAVYRDGKPRTLVVGRLETTRLVSRIGYWRLWAPKLQSINLAHGCVGEDLSDEAARLVVSTLLESLRAGAAVLAWLPWLDARSLLFSKINSMASFLCSDHFKGSTIHYGRRLKSDRGSFIESLSSHERNNHKRRARRLRAEFHGAVRMDCFDNVEQIDRLVRDVEIVMQRSYQRRLGVGFVNSERVYERLKFEAKKGWLRGYILYIRDAPCAFWIGSLYNGKFQSEFMGYDPTYGKYSPGMYLVVSALD